MLEKSFFVPAGGILPPQHEGLIVPVDKPKGISSFGVVRKIRKAVGIKKVGHAGTLDPMATGLLIVLVGRRATRDQGRFMRLPKAYTGTLRLGETTSSHDVETDVEERHDASAIRESDLERIRPEFTGTIQQVPPMYAAIKKGGVRLYKQARKGKTVEREPRPVEITELAWTSLRHRGQIVDATFRVSCSKGTYIRALARDIGERLGVGGHLTALRREAIGPHHANDAWNLETLVRETRKHHAT